MKNFPFPRSIKTTLTLLVFLLLPTSLFAFNFGLAVGVDAGYGNPGSEESSFDFQTNVLPSFSMLVGDNGEFIAMAGLSLGVGNSGFFFVPELLQTALTMRFGNMGIKAGRFNYSDPSSFVVEGLFDGFQFFYNSSLGNFHIGAWYTGFLYKKNAAILMTEGDQESYNALLDYGDFLNTYFAPRRIFASIGWEHLSLGEFIHLNTAIIAQFDLTKEEKYHSQYVVLKAGIPFKNFLFEFGGSLELCQTASKFGIALAGEFGVYWQLPTRFNSRLLFAGKIASGVTGNISAFVPITTKDYGYIFHPTLSGLSVFTLDYSARLTKAWGASATLAYFIRNDLGTYRGYPVDATGRGYFIGPDFSVNAVWSPFSDLQLNVTGGVFVPALGNAGPKEKAQWHIELAATIKIY
jgi:hypothetical protein